MHAFAYHRPTTLADAVAALSADGEAAALAGGMTYIPTLKQRLAQPTALVDLAHVADLRGISAEGGRLVIGAMTRHGDVERDPTVAQTIPMLAGLAHHIGDPQVRHRGTLGGSLANNDPSADYPAAVLALNADIHTDRRVIAADDYFRGMFQTALEHGELIVRVSFPVPDKAIYMKFPQPASRYALVGVCVAVTGGAVRVAVTGAGGGGVFRWTEAEQALGARFAADALEGVALASDGMIADLHGSAEYRAHLVRVQTRRAVAALA